MADASHVPSLHASSLMLNVPALVTGWPWLELECGFAVNLNAALSASALPASSSFQVYTLAISQGTSRSFRCLKIHSSSSPSRTVSFSMLMEQDRP